MSIWPTCALSERHAGRCRSAYGRAWSAGPTRRSGQRWLCVRIAISYKLRASKETCLGPMDAAAGGDCDIGVGVDGMLLNMVAPSTQQMQPLQLGCIIQRLGQSVERDQDRLVCENLCGRERVSAHIVGSLGKKIGKTISGMQGGSIQQTPTITPVRGCLRCSHTRQRACSICTTSYNSPREDEREKKKKGGCKHAHARACKRNPNISVWLLGC